MPIHWFDMWVHLRIRVRGRSAQLSMHASLCRWMPLPSIRVQWNSRRQLYNAIFWLLNSEIQKFVIFLNNCNGYSLHVYFFPDACFWACYKRRLQIEGRTKFRPFISWEILIWSWLWQLVPFMPFQSFPRENPAKSRLMSLAWTHLLYLVSV